MYNDRLTNGQLELILQLIKVVRCPGEEDETTIDQILEEFDNFDPDGIKTLELEKWTLEELNTRL
jgi:hypothetical protein